MIDVDGLVVENVLEVLLGLELSLSGLKLLLLRLELLLLGVELLLKLLQLELAARLELLLSRLKLLLLKVILRHILTMEYSFELYSSMLEIRQFLVFSIYTFR